MAKLYTVLSQRQSERMTDDSRFEEVITVTFKSAGGHVGSINVPLDQYEPSFVKGLLEERVAVLDAVHQLGE